MKTTRKMSNGQAFRKGHEQLRRFGTKMIGLIRFGNRFLGLSLLAALAFSTGQVQAATFKLNGGDYATPGNWDTGVVPAGADVAQIGIASGTRAATYSTASGYTTSGRLIIGWNGSAIGSLTMSTGAGTLTYGGNPNTSCNFLGVDGGNGTVNCNAGVLNFIQTSAPLYGFLRIGANNSVSGLLSIGGGTVNVGTSVSINTRYNLDIATAASSSGTITLSSGALNIGTGVAFDGSNTGGLVGYLYLGNNGGTAGSATVNLNGGTLSLVRFSIGTTTAPKTINLAGGTLQARATTANFLDAATGLTVNVKNGGATFDTGIYNITVGAPLVHFSGATTDSLTKIGDGTLTLSGANTYTGATTINAGTLKLTAGSLANTAISVNGTGTFAVQPGSTATLSTGTTGAGTAGATLNLGSRTFDMTDGFVSTFNLRQQDSFASAALTLTNGATLKFNLGNSSADLLAVTKGASVSNTINVTIDTAGATSLTPGTYTLITAASGLTAGTPTWQFSGGGRNQTVTVGSITYGLLLIATDTAVQVTVTIFGAVDASHSTVSPATAIRQANGTSTQVITVQARDVNNNNQTTSGDTVAFFATAGTMGPVTDNVNGTYTATWTSPAAVGSGSATVTATLGGTAVGTAVVASNCVITLTEASNASHSLVSPATATHPADGTGTQLITVQARDVNDLDQEAGGATVVMYATAGTMGPVTDLLDGTYTATWTSPASMGSGTATVTATLEGTAVGTAVGASNCVITLTVGAVNASHSTVSPATATKTADGASTQLITVQARDAGNNNRTSGGDTVVFTPTSGTMGPVTDVGNGTYTATWTAPTSAGSGTATITATLGDTAVGTAVSATSCVITLTAGAVDASHSTVSPATATKTANGTSTQVITVQARDINNNNRTSGGDTVVFSATSGTMGSVIDIGNGTYTATWTSPASVGSGSATVTATLGGTAVGTAAGASSCVITLNAFDYTWDGTDNLWNSLHWLPGPVVGPTGNSPAISAGINSGTVSFAKHDTFGIDSTPSTPVITINGGTLASGGWFNTMWNLNMGGGTLLANGGANASFPAFQLAGTLTVSGSTASTITAGSGSFNMINLGGTGNSNLTVNVADVTGDTNADLIINAVLKNRGSTGALTKSGLGTLKLSAENTYTGATTVDAGMLALGANNVLADTTAISLGSGTLDAATFTDTFGTLDVTSTNATIHLGAGAKLAFANSRAIDWTDGKLNITGTFVSGSSIRFGTGSDGLTYTQLNLIALGANTRFSLNYSGYLCQVTGTLIMFY